MWKEPQNVVSLLSKGGTIDIDKTHVIGAGLETDSPKFLRIEY